MVSHGLCLVLQDQLQDRVSQGAAHHVPAALAVLPRLLREWGLLHPYVPRAWHLSRGSAALGTSSALVALGLILRARSGR